MNLSSIVLVIVAVAGICIAITVAILYSLRPSILEGLSPKSGKLSSQTSIGDPSQARDLFMAQPTGTLTVYIHCESNSKTAIVGNQQPLRILQLGSSVQLQVTQGTGLTKLIVRTQGQTIQNESIPLKAFPEQKWVHVAIVREGRRYTVYYNGKIAGSSRTQYFPTINTSQFFVGDERLRGMFAFPKLAPTAYTLDEINKELRTTSDTRHKPYLDQTTSNFFSFFTCPNGIFCFSTSSQPRLNPLKRWKTPYA
jgi:hypothetical protein